MPTLFLIIYLTTPPTQGHFCTIDDPDFKEYRYEEQIPYCERNVSLKRKDDICKRDLILDRTEFTVDHIIPLAIGGSNHDDNLWCQHKSISVTDIEYTAYIKLRDNEMTQQQAVDMVLDAKFKTKP